MKNSGSSGASKGANANGIAYGQPYLQNSGAEGTGSAQRVSANSNLKSYINELKKASNANKSGGNGTGKRGYSSSRQAAAAANTQKSAAYNGQQTQGVVQAQSYGGSGGVPQTTKNVSGQFILDYPHGNSQVQISSKSGAGAANTVSRNIQQQQMSELALKDNVTGVVAGKSTSNLTQLVSPSNTFVRSGSRQGTSNQNNRALSNGQMPNTAQVNAQSQNHVLGATQQQFLAGFISPQGTNGMLNQTQQVFSQSATKINAGNASSKAYQYLQKKGNLQGGHQDAVVATAQAERANNHLIKRIVSGRKQIVQVNASHDQQRPSRKANTRGAARNQSQPAFAAAPGQPQKQKSQQLSSGQDPRIQKDVIIRKNSSKSLLPGGAAQAQQAAMPNIGNVKSKQDAHKNKGHQAAVLLLKTESTDRETANTSKVGAATASNHKRLASHPANYVKIQNSEVSSAGGTADVGLPGNGLIVTNNYTNGQRGVPHTLGNTLGGQKQSLNMSNYGGCFSAIQRDSSLNENNTLAKTGINLSSLIRQNLLEEDGIEDLHFYFVSFQQHKKHILTHQKRRQDRIKQQVAGQANNGSASGAGNGPRMVVPKIPISGIAARGVVKNAAISSQQSGSNRNNAKLNNSKMSPVMSRGEIETEQNKTIESFDDEDFL